MSDKFAYAMDRGDDSDVAWVKMYDDRVIIVNGVGGKVEPDDSGWIPSSITLVNSGLVLKSS